MAVRIHIHFHDEAPWDESKHPRADNGEFGHGSHGAHAAPAPSKRAAAEPPERQSAAQNTSAGVAPVTLTPTSSRGFTGQPVETRTTLSKIQSGATGEAIAIAWLQANGMPDAKALNLRTTNFPVDLIGDHQLIEVKAGLISNGKGAQKWRATIGGASKDEAAWYASATPEEKTAWNQKKVQAIMDRKNAVLADYSQRLGIPMKAKTLTSIINPDTKTVDLYLFDGFHSMIGWNSADAKKAHVGSYQYA